MRGFWNENAFVIEPHSPFVAGGLFNYGDCSHFGGCVGGQRVLKTEELSEHKSFGQKVVRHAIDASGAGLFGNVEKHGSPTSHAVIERKHT